MRTNLGSNCPSPSAHTQARCTKPFPLGINPATPQNRDPSFPEGPALTAPHPRRASATLLTGSCVLSPNNTLVCLSPSEMTSLSRLSDDVTSTVKHFPNSPASLCPPRRITAPPPCLHDLSAVSGYSNTHACYGYSNMHACYILLELLCHRPFLSTEEPERLQHTSYLPASGDHRYLPQRVTDREALEMFAELASI